MTKLPGAHENESKAMKIIKVLQTVLCILYVVFMCIQVIYIYISGAERRKLFPMSQIFTRENVVNAVLRGLPVLVAAIIVTIIAVVIKSRLNNKEKSFVKNEYKNCNSKQIEKRQNDTKLIDQPPKDIKHITDNQNNKNLKTESLNRINRIKIIRLSILIIAIVFIVLGIFNGSAKAVLSKAITICTECIGLG